MTSEAHMHEPQVQIKDQGTSIRLDMTSKSRSYHLEYQMERIIQTCRNHVWNVHYYTTVM